MPAAYCRLTEEATPFTASSQRAPFTASEGGSEQNERTLPTTVYNLTLIVNREIPAVMRIGASIVEKLRQLPLRRRRRVGRTNTSSNRSAASESSYVQLQLQQTNPSFEIIKDAAKQFRSASRISRAENSNSFLLSSRVSSSQPLHRGSWDPLVLIPSLRILLSDQRDRRWSAFEIFRDLKSEPGFSRHAGGRARACGNYAFLPG